MAVFYYWKISQKFGDKNSQNKIHGRC